MKDWLEAQTWMRRQVARRNLIDNQWAMNAAYLVELETEKLKEKGQRK
jgi:hypothetical protein